jgi:hypothetical protein
VIPNRQTDFAGSPEQDKIPFFKSFVRIILFRAFGRNIDQQPFVGKFLTAADIGILFRQNTGTADLNTGTETFNKHLFRTGPEIFQRAISADCNKNTTEQQSQKKVDNDPPSRLPAQLTE